MGTQGSSETEGPQGPQEIQGPQGLWATAERAAVEVIPAALATVAPQAPPTLLTLASYWSSTANHSSLLSVRSA